MTISELAKPLYGNIGFFNNGDSVAICRDGSHVSPVLFNPLTGEKIPSTDFYDAMDGVKVVFFNPWDGKKREPSDINNDPLGENSFVLEHLTHFDLVVKKMRNRAPSSEILELFNSKNMSADFIYGEKKYSFLMLLAYHGYKDLFFEFYDRASNLDHVNLYGENVFHLSVRTPDILSFLLKTGRYSDVDVNYAPEKNSAIIIAASHIVKNHSFEDNIRSIKMLVDAGGNINHQNAHGRTALMSAATSNNYDFIEFILSLGADKTIKDNSGLDAKDHARLYSRSLLGSRG